MKLLLVVSLFALTLTTGFTCSKNTPESVKSETPAQDSNSAQPGAAQPTQEQMAQPSAETPPASEASTAQPAPEKK